MKYQQEQITPYNLTERKGKQVEDMFDRIAHSYDLLNHLLSLGIDRSWRRSAIDSLLPFAPQHLLDVATGTADFALLAAKRLQPQSIIGVDLSEGMLSVGRQKIKAMGEEKRIHLQKEDCMHLSFKDESFDAITVAYGVRNFENLDRGLIEMHRVLRKEGKLVIIELTSPHRAPMKQLFYFYAKILMPLLGKLISKDTHAYTYLPESMAAFPQGEVMQDILQKAGFTNVHFQRFTFGLSTLYTAQK